jgi:hypothetical protein
MCRAKKLGEKSDNDYAVAFSNVGADDTSVRMVLEIYETPFVVAAIWSPKCKHSMLTADVYHYISTVQHAEGLAVGIDVYPFL